MERSEAEAIYDAGREVVVEVLLRMDRQIELLTARVDRLERELARNSRNSSRPPSSEPPGNERGRRAETGWRLRGQRRTLWGAFTKKVAVYRIACDRREDRARELLEGNEGIVTSDRFRAAGIHLIESDLRTAAPRCSAAASPRRS